MHRPGGSMKARNGTFKNEPCLHLAAKRFPTKFQILRHALISELKIGMLVRLTRAKRLRAGWFVALVYLLCVLAPGISFAFSDGSRAAPCLTDENHGLGIIHVHEYGEGASQHVHKDGHLNEQGGEVHFNKSKNLSTISVADETPAAPAKDHHKASGAQCCGMVCLSALPTTVIDLVNPLMPTSVCVSETYPNVADRAPPRHYRPLRDLT